MLTSFFPSFISLFCLTFNYVFPQGLSNFLHFIVNTEENKTLKSISVYLILKSYTDQITSPMKLSWVHVNVCVYTCRYTYIYLSLRVEVLLVIVGGNGHTGLSSNPEGDLISPSANIFWKMFNSNCSPSSKGLIVVQIGLFSLGKRRKTQTENAVWPCVTCCSRGSIG